MHWKACLCDCCAYKKFFCLLLCGPCCLMSHYADTVSNLPIKRNYCEVFCMECNYPCLCCFESNRTKIRKLYNI